MPYEFESDVHKIVQAGTNSHILIAGNALYATEIVENIALVAGDATVEQVADAVRQSFVNKRREIISRRVLEPRGLTLETYYQIQTQLVMAVVQEIENNLVNFDIGVEILVTGLGSDGLYHLYSVTNPGELVCHDAIGFVCTGIGAPYAMYHFIGSGYKKAKSVEDVEQLVKDAKKQSEVAPGVGTETELKTFKIKTERKK